MANYKLTAFTATQIPNTVVGANSARRTLRIISYGPPDFIDGNTVWVDHTGHTAVFQACLQLIPGVFLEWGVPDPKEASHPAAMYLPNCPTAAISVVCGTGLTHQGIIEEGF